MFNASPPSLVDDEDEHALIDPSLSSESSSSLGHLTSDLPDDEVFRQTMQPLMHVMF